MNDEKTGYKILGYIAVGILFTCFLFAGFGKRDETLGELQTSTDTTLGNIKAEQSSIGVEISRSQIASDNIKETIGRINTEIDGSRKTAGEITTGIENLEQLIVECERLAGENARIIDEANKAN